MSGYHSSRPRPRASSSRNPSPIDSLIIRLLRLRKRHKSSQINKRMHLVGKTRLLPKNARARDCVDFEVSSPSSATSLHRPPAGNTSRPTSFAVTGAIQMMNIDRDSRSSSAARPASSASCAGAISPTRSSARRVRFP